jgi:hypothetical protein
LNLENSKTTMRSLLKISFLGLFLSASSSAFADAGGGGVGDSCKQKCCNTPNINCKKECLDNCQKEKKEFYKNFNNKFQGVQNKAVYVSNKYGKVDVKTGAANEVTVTVRVTVRANNENEANQVLNRINVALKLLLRKTTIGTTTATIRLIMR